MTFDSIINRGEYLSAFYVAEKLPADIKKHLLDTWTLRENDPNHHGTTPRQELRKLRGTYLNKDARPLFAHRTQADADNGGSSGTYRDPVWNEQLRAWHRHLLTSLGYDGEPTQLTVHNAGRDHTLEVAWHGDEIVALHCGWAADIDATLEPDGPGRLLTPVRISANESYETGPKLASWLFGGRLPGGEPPRFVLLLCGGVIVLADRRSWAEGRFLAANLDTALERNDTKQTGELATIAALFSREMLVRGDKAAPIDELLTASTNNATGVTGELRTGLQRSVEIIANEVLARLDQAGVSPKEIEGRIPFARQLTRETLRYLYRILFLLYAEARPELGILPADDQTYEAGYSMARLRELVARDEQLAEDEVRHGFHLHISLDVLFDKVNNGHRPRQPDKDDDGDRGLRFEPLRSTLFEPESITLIGRIPDPRNDNGATLDLRLRNESLHQVLRLLTMKKGSAHGDRGGFISYRNLGINQLGAVYEGLMSYSGILAEEELCEVADTRQESAGGSWLVPAHRQGDYGDALVQYDEHDERRGLRGPKRYHVGEFVYRLVGRDRETSASYYTPEALTRVTVERALTQRLDDGNARQVRAAELLRWTICEPALGSGAFANEAINQVAEEYLRRRQDELGVSIPASELLTEKQKVKAYIALHNVYGVDLNATGVELAEVSLWLNTMHPGMQAPWFGLHLRRGNSLIGARRAVYTSADLTATERAWLKAKGGLAPTPAPLRAQLPDGAVHQFLLPNPGWAAITGSAKAKEFIDTQALARWKKDAFASPKTKQDRQKQFYRLQAAARRVEFLWSLVVKRMEISEQAISRRIGVWGADPTNDEFTFLHQPAHPVSKEQVLEDLFDSVDTPYWRLKTVMDAWCALWFWPADQADLLDGSHRVYMTTPSERLVPDISRVATAAPDLRLPNQQEILFAIGGEQITFDDLAPVNDLRRKTPAKKDRGPLKLRRPIIPLATLDDWLDFLESLLGTADPREGRSLVESFDDLDTLSAYEDQLPDWMGMDRGDPEQRFPWLGSVRDIAEDQGFLHWELEFAWVFQDKHRGGFDLQVGNPPWVRPEWKEDPVLAEFDPWFVLAKKPSAETKARRRWKALADRAVREHILEELTVTETTAAFLASPQVYPLIAGGQPDLYRAFMCRTWDNNATHGCIGLLHPDTHFSGDKEARLREAAYRRLRVHADFVNAGNRFFPPPVGRASHFGMHVYGAPGEIGFDHLSWLFSVDALRLSSSADNNKDAPAPGVRFEGRWDERPHPARIVRVTTDTLRRWQRLTGEHDKPPAQSKLLTPVSTAEDPAIDALGQHPTRLGELGVQIASGFHESGAKKAQFGPDRDTRLIDYNRNNDDRDDFAATSWKDVVLRGPQLGLANPMCRQPSQGSELRGLNPATLPADAVPESEYRRVAPRDVYLSEQEQWIDYVDLARRRASAVEVESARGAVAEALVVALAEVTPKQVDKVLTQRSRKPYTSFYRLAWRRQIAPNTERALYAAILPPGPTHIDLVHSLAMPSTGATVVTAALWSSLPVDYMLRASGRGDLRKVDATAMPALQLPHPLADSLIMRTLRLNCLTSAYTALWEELFMLGWTTERWAVAWPDVPPLEAVTPGWQYDIPLRSELARRAALVELDALAAVCLGIDAETLAVMYRARFPVMQDFDAITWFDVNGRKIGGDYHIYGFGQTKEHWSQFQNYLESRGSAPPPDSYTPPFYKANREKEMWEAHAVFQARLDAAVARGEWDPATQTVPQR